MIFGRRIRQHIVEHWTEWIPWVLGVLVCAGYFATMLGNAGTWGFPLDDAYIYLTYAKQFATLEPFSYFEGSGYTAGATSPLWPVLLAPLWAVGLRGELFALGSFLLCSVFLVLSIVWCYRLARHFGGRSVGLFAAVCATCSAPISWIALAGMEAGFAMFILLALALQLLRENSPGKPSKKLLTLLAVASVARPEATILVGLIVCVRAAQCVWKKDWKASAKWCLPLAVPLVWVISNKLWAGHFFPNTGVAKSHFYLPGFSWAYYAETVWNLSGQMLGGMFWKSGGPFWGKGISLALWFAGGAAILRKVQGHWLGVFVLLAIPWMMFFAVVFASGQWGFQNYRYVGPGLPAFWVVSACAIIWVIPFFAKTRGVVSVVTIGILCVGVAILSGKSLKDEMVYFAQGVRDTNAQVVKIGKWIDQNLPKDAYLAFHDAGAMAYFGARRVYDIIGLVTNHQTEHCNNGPGSRFERLEHLPIDDRPDYIAYYPGWLLGYEPSSKHWKEDFFGKELFSASLPKSLGSTKKRLAGGGTMKVFKMEWVHVNTGHLPINIPDGWKLVDRLDVADLRNEKAHNYEADQGPRNFHTRTNHWSVYNRSQVQGRPMADGGRVIRGKGEKFWVNVDHEKPVLVVIRSGGRDSYGGRIPRKKVTLEVSVGQERLEAVLPPWQSKFDETTLQFGEFSSGKGAIPVKIRNLGENDYRVFHYFFLQPVTGVAPETRVDVPEENDTLGNE